MTNVALVFSMVAALGYAVAGCSDSGVSWTPPSPDARSTQDAAPPPLDGDAAPPPLDGDAAPPPLDGDAARDSSGTNDSAVAGDASPSSSCAPAPTSSLVVNVKDTGATGDGTTNDTTAIQAAIDQVGGTGGTVLVPDGTYMIDAIKQLNLSSDMTLRMTSGAVLHAIANGADTYAIIYIGNASNVNVVGGAVRGERTQHTGTTGEWGMGVWIVGSHNVAIDGVTATECWGDGFYQAGGGPQSTNISLCGLTSDDNRRQGLSIENVDGMVVQRSTFTNTNGTAPEAGIDVEPYAADQSVTHLRIVDCRFVDNAGSGIQLWAGGGPISNVTLDSNTVTGNNEGIVLHETNGNAITDNAITDAQVGIDLGNDSTANVITGNIITGPAPGQGIANDPGGNTISGNTVP